MLHNFAIYYGVAKNRRLTTCCWFGRSTALSQIDDMVAENDKVVIRYTVIGGTNAGIAIHRLTNDKIVEIWDVSADIKS